MIAPEFTTAAAAAGCRPLPGTGAVTGVLEALAFFRDGDLARRRFERFGNVYETRLLGQPLVFIRGGTAIRELLGSRSLANRNGADQRARRRVVGQLFTAAALRRCSPGIVALVNELAPDQDLSLQLVPSPSPRGGLLVTAAARSI